MKKYKWIVISCVLCCSNIFAQTKVWSIEDCIQYAIDHNLSVQQQLLNLEETKLSVSDAKGNYLPNLNASMGNSWNQGLSQSLTSGVLVKEVETIRYSSYGISSNIPIYSGMQNYHTYQQAKLQEVAAKFNIESVKDDIKLNVANGFLQLLLQKENIQILNKQYQLSLEQLKRSKEMVNSGTLPKGDLLQLEATIATDLQNIAQAENSYVIAELSLKRLLNLNMGDSIKVKTEEVSLIEMELLKTPVHEILENVLQNRNEIKLSETNIDIANEGVKIAKGNYLPTLSGFVNLASRETELSEDSFKNQLEENYGLTFGVNLSIPIFNRFQVKNNVARNELNVLQAENELAQTKQTVAQNVYQAYSNAKASHKTYQASVKTVEAQKNAFDYQKVRFEVGESNLLDFLQNRTLYQNSQTELLRAKYDLLFSLKILELYYLGIQE